MWTNPKTNWVATDKVNVSDFNRIKNNMQHLIDLAHEMFSEFDVEALAKDQTHTDLPYASMWNAIERDIDHVYKHMYQFKKEDTKTWYPNNKYVDYVNLNRIESTQLAMYQYLIGQRSGALRLAFSLGKKPLGNRG